MAAERAGRPFLVYRDATGEQRIHTLPDDPGPFAIGRGDRCAVRLERDPEVSRLHASLERIAEDWVLGDDGLSRNGTFVNHERLAFHRRLRDGDVIRCGQTQLSFHDPRDRPQDGTAPGGEPERVSLTDTQHRVLVALCRPLLERDPFALPASNRAIAEELHLSVGAVKGHLRTLFARLAVDRGLAHNHKRLALAESAIQGGTLSLRDLGADTTMSSLPPDTGLSDSGRRSPGR